MNVENVNITWLVVASCTDCPNRSVVVEAEDHYYCKLEHRRCCIETCPLRYYDGKQQRFDDVPTV